MTAGSPCRRSPARLPPKAPSASSSSPTSRTNIRHGHRVAGRRHHPSSRRSDRGAERACRHSRRHGTDLRPDLRGRKAPPPQAPHLSRSRQARHHQRAGLRRLRRLRREVELRLGAAARNRMGPQAHHRPVELQQGLFLRQGLLPVVRHRAWRTAEERRRRRRRSRTAGAAGSEAAGDRADLQHHRHRRRRHRHRHDRRHTGHGGASGRAAASACSTWRGSRRRAARCSATSASPQSPRTSMPSASPRAAPISCSAATSWSRARARCSPRSSPARPRWWSIPPNSCPANSPAMPISRCRASGSSATIMADAGRDKTHFIDATRIATALFGQSIGANMFLVGYAYQLGAIPLSAAAIERAIELNGEAVGMNKAAFHWGRRAAVDRAAVEALAKPAAATADDARHLSESFDETVERRVKFLTDYQDAAYAARYRGWVEKAQGGRGGACAGQDRARRRGRALSVQADGLQGRIRSRAALHRRRIPQAGRRARSRGDESALRVSSCAAAAGAPRPAPPACRAR